MGTLKKLFHPSKCLHVNFVAKTNVIRLTKEGKGAGLNDQPEAFAAEVEIKCNDCGLPFQFLGVAPGYSPKEPKSSADYTQLRIPVRPFK